MTSNASTHTAPAGRSQGRGVNSALWAIQAVAAALFIFAAAAKLTSMPQVVATFDTIGFGGWFRYLIGVLEIAGAVALFIPRLAGLAGLAFVGLTVGAFFTHLIVIGGGLAMVLPALILSAIVAWGRRQSTAELWRLVTNRWTRTAREIRE